MKYENCANKLRFIIFALAVVPPLYPVYLSLDSIVIIRESIYMGGA